MSIEEIIQGLANSGFYMAELGTATYLGKRVYDERRMRNQMKKEERNVEHDLLIKMAQLQSGHRLYQEIPSYSGRLKRWSARLLGTAKSAYGWSKYFKAGKPDEIRLRLIEHDGSQELSMELIYRHKVKYSGVFDLHNQTRDSISMAAFNLEVKHGYPFKFYG